LVYFAPFWYFGPRKIWQPWQEPFVMIKSRLAKGREHQTVIMLNFEAS
jgi:hypothetical protein